MPTGTIVPGKVELRVFFPNIFDNPLTLILDLIRIAIVLLLIILMLIEIVEKRKKKIPFADSISVNMVLNTGILVLYIITFSIKIIYLKKDKAVYFNSEKYVNTYEVADYFNYVFYLECCLVSLVFIKMLNFLKIIDYVRLFYISIFIGFRIMAKYLIFVVLILFGFSSIAVILWGPFMINYRNIGDSFLNILLFSTGNIFK